MALITITQGGSDIPDGVYPVILVELRPDTLTPNTGPNAGQEVSVLKWKVAVDEGEYEGTELDVTSSIATGPRSKLYSFVTALQGGKTPAIGDEFDAPDLVGRRALATIRRDDTGWPRVVSLGAMPTTLGSRKPAAVAERQPVAAGVSANDTVDDIPF